MHITITKEVTHQKNWSPRRLQAEDIGLKSPQRVSTTCFSSTRLMKEPGEGGGEMWHLTCRPPARFSPDNIFVIIKPIMRIKSVL